MSNAAQWAIADMSRWSVIKVRKACHDAGLPGSGRKAHLLRRFSEHLKEQEPRRLLRDSHEVPAHAQGEPSSAAAAAAVSGEQFVGIPAVSGGGGGAGRSVAAPGTPEGFSAIGCCSNDSTTPQSHQKDTPEQSLPAKEIQDESAPGTTDANPSTPARPQPLSFDKIALSPASDDGDGTSPIDHECTSQQRSEESLDEKWPDTSVDDDDMSSSTSQLSFLASLRNLVNRAQQDQLLPQKELHRVTRSLSHAKQLLLSNLKARDVDVEAMGVWMADTRARLRESVRSSMADVYVV